MSAIVRATPSPELLKRRLGNGGYQLVDGELEKRCTTCREFWPADSEFFHTSAREADGLAIYCKPCYWDARNGRRKSQPQQAIQQSQTNEKETQHMNNIRRQDLLALLRQRPGILAVQVSDLMDLDLEDAVMLLQAAERDKQVIAEPTKAPNGQDAVAYRVDPTYLGWKAPAETTAATSGEAAKPASTEPAEKVNAQPGTPSVKRVSKVDEAIAYLVKNGPTAGAALKAALGLSYPASTLLGVALAAGSVHRIDGIYCVPDHLDRISKSSVETIKAKPEPVRTSTNSRPESDGRDIAKVAVIDCRQSGGPLVDLLRATLTAEEYRGYLKGMVLQNTLRPEQGRDAHHYQEASMFAAALAEQAATTV